MVDAPHPDEVPDDPPDAEPGSDRPREDAPADYLGEYGGEVPEDPWEDLALDPVAEAAAADLTERRIPVPAEWTAAAPGHLAGWEAHKEKWAETSHSVADLVPAGTDRPVDPAGSWRGESGRYLTPEQNAQVDNARDRIAISEWVITAELREVETDSIGGLANLNNRLKGEERLKEKVADALKAAPVEDAAIVTYELHDCVRYTVQYEDHNYSAGVAADVNRLRDTGYELTTFKNLWDNGSYVGINSRWRDPLSTQPFEIQFHTPTSLAAKELTHEAYERMRDPRTSAAERVELDEFQATVSRSIPTPDGAPDLDFKYGERT